MEMTATRAASQVDGVRSKRFSEFVSG